MNILITGGAGFIGYHLARFHLQRGDAVTILDNHFKDGGRADEAFQVLAAHPGVRAIAADLTVPLSGVRAEGPFDVVYHLAAINGTRLFYEIPFQVARTNLLMTLHLLDWLAAQPVGRLLYASTSEVYAGCEDVGLLAIPTGEDTPVVFPQPTNVRFCYGTSKFMGEFLCLQFGRERAVPTSVVRYHNVYGPRMGDKHVIPEFIARAHRGERPFRVYGGDETRAFCYVDDAVEATWRIAATPACADEILHVGNAQEEISMASLARVVIAQAGASEDLLECGRRSGSVSRRCPDTSKLRRLTGFMARVGLQEGLAKTREWIITHPTADRPAEGLKAPDISIVVPVYNERSHIAPTVERLVAAFGPLAASCEILFVDDQSPDGTAAEVERVAQDVPQVRLVQHGKKAGLGAAHHAGYHAARGRYVMCLDADLSQSPEELVRMKRLLDEGYDLVIGSRYMASGRQIGKSWLRDWGSQGMNWIVRAVLGMRLTDSTHTFRAFRASVHEAVCSRLDQRGHPGFQIQFSFWALRRGFRATEIPVTFVERAAGEGASNISIRREVPPFMRLVVRLFFSRFQANAS